MPKALVTGASEGIGRAFSKQLAAQGYELTVVARNEKRLAEFVKEISGARHQILVADLSTNSGIEKVTRDIRENHYDVLINNAGFGVYGRFDQASLEKLQEMLRLNCQALVVLSHAYLQGAKAGDALLNVSSTLAFLPMPFLSVYSATKAFVTSFSESLWYEQKEKDVFVMGLCPGITSTNFHDRAGGKGHDMPSYLTQTPDQVATIGLRALSRRCKPTVICGASNFMAASATRLITRSATVRMIGRQSQSQLTSS